MKDRTSRCAHIVLISFSVVLAGIAMGCRPADTTSDLDLSQFDLVDLTHTLDESTIYWPTDTDGFVLDGSSGETDAGFFYAANSFSTAEHGGTHLDAPFHFAANGQKTDEIPLSRLVGKAVVIDVSEQAATNREYQILTSDIADWESRNGAIPDNAIVLFRTGFGERWPDRESYLGTSKVGAEAIPELRFPGIHPETSRWLVQNRKIASIGLDTPSIDYGQSSLFETHQILFAADIPAFENVANLNGLPETGTYVFALPTKIGGGSGGPLRIIALVPIS